MSTPPLESSDEFALKEDRSDNQCHYLQIAQRIHSCSANDRVFVDSRSCTEFANQQVIYTNAQNLQVQPVFRDDRSRDFGEKDCSSIIISVGGTLSRPLRKKSLLIRDHGDFKSTIKERISTMYLNEWLADVYFLVGTEPNQERIPAHSFILSVASAPFAAMFHSGFEHRSEISVPDVEPGAFKTLLRYLYTDEINLQPDNVISTLYVAKKYLITYLYNAAIEFMDANLNAGSVCSLLMQRRLFEEDELMTRCWKVVDANAEKVLTSDGFTEIDHSLLLQILSRETLIVTERSVYEAAMKWAKAECKRRGLNPTASDFRNVLGSAMFSIRFPAMTISDFANESEKSNLLSCQEINDIFHFFLARNKPSLPFFSSPRKGLSLLVCSRFQGTLHGSNQWRYFGRCDSIQFLVDRRIFVAGYGLYGSSSGPSEYKVKMEIKKRKEVLGSIETSFSSSGQPCTFPVRFNTPVQVEAYVVYTASVVVEGKDLSHFGHDGLPEVCVQAEDSKDSAEETVNFYFTASEDSKNGTGVQGGQIPEIMFYM
ncbi:unnamed protein product [Enterobius vermicularis]|uniref:BTB domain-containing protein n=1 Tax=Enterobius vermicularis TaxID=51028 RepID=A0A0N4V6S5_ENTVE|nr:unnamed protein product [Enterobius vermicularis]